MKAPVPPGYGGSRAQPPRAGPKIRASSRRRAALSALGVAAGSRRNQGTVRGGMSILHSAVSGSSAKQNCGAASFCLRDFRVVLSLDAPR